MCVHTLLCCFLRYWNLNKLKFNIWFKVSWMLVHCLFLKPHDYKLPGQGVWNNRKKTTVISLRISSSIRGRMKIFRICKRSWTKFCIQFIYVIARSVSSCGSFWGTRQNSTVWYPWRNAKGGGCFNVHLFKITYQSPSRQLYFSAIQTASSWKPLECVSVLVQ